MKELRIDDVLVHSDDYRNNQEVEEVRLLYAYAVLSFSTFSHCSNLKNVYFGLDITRIGHRTFEYCTSLTDVWFPIVDENKIIEIASDAFIGCPKNLTFHVFASAVKNKSINDFARKHGFRVESMI